MQYNNSFLFFFFFFVVVVVVAFVCLLSVLVSVVVNSFFMMVEESVIWLCLADGIASFLVASISWNFFFFFFFFLISHIEVVVILRRYVVHFRVTIFLYHMVGCLFQVWDVWGALWAGYVTKLSHKNGEQKSLSAAACRWWATFIEVNSSHLVIHWRGGGGNGRLPSIAHLAFLVGLDMTKLVGGKLKTHNISRRASIASRSRANRLSCPVTLRKE